jgi:radical SAM protein with 4Fe4S-binding SPASM domain
LGIELKLLQMMLRQNILGKGIEAKPLTPTVASFAVTKACNLNCLHCHAEAREPFPNELTIPEGAKVITDLAELGTQALIFTGGEPMIRKDMILTLAEYAVDNGIIPAMLTNGGFIQTKKAALELKEAGIMALGIPIDSVEPEKHDWLRQVPGTFAKAINAIKICREVDLKVVVTTMALQTNYKQLPQMVELLQSLDLDMVAIYDLVPQGRGKDVEELLMTDTQRLEVFRYLQKVQETREMLFMFSGGQPLYPSVITEMQKQHGTKPKNLLLKEFWVDAQCGWPAGIQYISIRPNGDVFPCPFLPLKAGNVREKNMVDIWYHSPLLKTLRDRSNLHGECKTCEFRETCGGCRGRAHALTGDYLGDDIACLKKVMNKEGITPDCIEHFGWCVG